MTADLKEYIKEWLQKAERDIITAQRLIEIEPMILDYACFHSQQAVEKSLKAFLLYYGKEIEKTHDIIFLLSECSKSDPVFGTIDPLDINAYSVQSRYPNFNMPGVEDAKKLYQLAIDVNRIVTEKIILM